GRRHARRLELALRARVLRGGRTERALPPRRAAAPRAALARDALLRGASPGARARARATGRLALAIPSASHCWAVVGAAAAMRKGRGGCNQTASAEVAPPTTC